MKAVKDIFSGVENEVKIRSLRGYQAKGMFRVVRGTVKEIAGKLTSNTTLGVKGKFDRLAGKIQWRFGKVQGICGL
jgi:uncharacterized protein YjbJ (UPF0337 family)